jgi:hypothetical protein
MWRDTGTGTCTHVDVADSGLELLPDEVDVYDPEYLLEVGSVSGTTPKYCDTSSAYMTRVLYVRTPRRDDRGEELAPVLRTKVEHVNYWVWKSARQTGGKRHVRFVCNADDKILIDRLTLPNDADLSLNATVTALRNAGYASYERKYLVFVDWRERDPASGDRLDDKCGRGELRPDDSPGPTNANNQGNQISVIYLRASICTAWAHSVMHELGHVLGAVQDSARNYDESNPGHPTDEHDVMAYGDKGTTKCTDATNEHRYDCGKNDYFNTSPATTDYLTTKWNLARSRFLVTP